MLSSEIRSLFRMYVVLLYALNLKVTVILLAFSCFGSVAPIVPGREAIVCPPMKQDENTNQFWFLTPQSKIVGPVERRALTTGKMKT